MGYEVAGHVQSKSWKRAARSCDLSGKISNFYFNTLPREHSKLDCEISDYSKLLAMMIIVQSHWTEVT
jgi:hypothetical protein